MELQEYESWEISLLIASKPLHTICKPTIRTRNCLWAASIGKYGEREGGEALQRLIAVWFGVQGGSTSCYRPS